MPDCRKLMFHTLACLALGVGGSAVAETLPVPPARPATGTAVPEAAIVPHNPVVVAPTAFAAPAIAQPAIAGPDQRQVECVAKVVLHEAGPRAGPGQVAVAQVIRARVRSGRFAADACGVVKQRGQFFNVDAYNPPRSGSAWTSAVAVATRVLSDIGDELAPGALFFHARSARMIGHALVAEIGGNLFYR